MLWRYLQLEKVFCYLSCILYFYIPDILANATVEQLLEKGTRLLAAGQLSDALAMYIQAVDEDPKNHLSYYRRGSAYLALGNVRLALPDFDTSVKLNAAFIPAIKQRANLYLKTGRLSEAKSDFNLLLPSDPEASVKLSQVIDFENHLSDARSFYNHGDYEEALKLLDIIVDALHFNQEIREMRSRCYLKLGDTQKGIQEMRFGVHLLNDNREGLLKLSVLMFDAGQAVQSLEEIRECLRLDQDDKNCMKHYRRVKKVAKTIMKARDAVESSQYKDCIKSASDLLELEKLNPEYELQAKVLLCQCHSQAHTEDGVTYCSEVVKHYPNNLDLKCDLAESYINVDKFDEAIELCQKILEEDRGQRRAKDLIKKAQKLLKASQRKNYYKVLGVDRSATKQEIAKAYRKKAKTSHPDLFDDAEKKKKAEKDFMALSEAKEVLTNDEMRARFDNGEDPLDQNQQGEHGGPFGPFSGFSFANMHPFEGGNFEFHFG